MILKNQIINKLDKNDVEKDYRIDILTMKDINQLSNILKNITYVLFIDIRSAMSMTIISMTTSLRI
jgi:hypothetical protein